MPTISVNRDDIIAALALPKSKEGYQKFEELCFHFGLEAEVTSVKDMAEKETGKSSSSVSDELIYRVEIPANRYDLLSFEGLAQTLGRFSGQRELPQYTTKTPQQPMQLIVTEATQKVRPIVVAAILRNVTLTKKSLESFIDFQDRLHQTLARKRSIASIGTHDLDSVEGPFTYTARPPNKISFAPLDNEKVFDACAMFEHFDKNAIHLKPYCELIRASPLYPIIHDNKGVVLSLPPVINSNHSKITLGTKNIFIEVTALDLTKANIVLNTLVATFSEYCAEKYSCERVRICYPDGRTDLTPNYSTSPVSSSISFINSRLGLSLKPTEIENLLWRMSVPNKIEDGKNLIAFPTPLRSDLFHAVDLLEDVAVAYGYNNLPVEFPHTPSVGCQDPVNKLTELLRPEIAHAGFTEVLTLSLCSHADNFALMNKKDEGTTAVKLANPKSMEFQVGRTSLLPGLLKSLSCNRSHPLPHKIFEISDVMRKCSVDATGAINRRHFAAIYTSKQSGFEKIRGLLDRTMTLLQLQDCYSVVPSEDPSFFPGRRVDIYVKKQKVGVYGILHPIVLNNFEIGPASALEIDIQHFV